MYSFEGRVRYSECDENGQLSLVGMMNYLQDCSTFHCEDRASGIRALGEQGLGWILASWQIEVDRLPMFGEKITVNTWCYQMKSLQALRCFTICDEKGAELVRADSQWFVYDLVAGRVCHVPECEQVYLEDTPRAEMPKMDRKLPIEGEGQTTTAITVSEQHLDTNRHVNNAQYVLFAQDALAELGITGELARLDVLYRTMAWPGDTIVPCAHECEGGHVVELTDGAEKTYAIVRLRGKEC